jgi:hypothetical protein
MQGFSIQYLTFLLVVAIVLGVVGLSWPKKKPRLERCSQCKYVGILDNHIRPNSQTCPNTDGFANREEV